MRCSCGSTWFIGHQLIRADVVVDGNGEFLENCEPSLEAANYDAEKPYGPFTCTVCGKEYEELTVEKEACHCFRRASFLHYRGASDKAGLTITEGGIAHGR